MKISLPDKSAEQPDERLFELIVGLGRDIIVLQVLLPMKGDLLGCYLALKIKICLVSHYNNRDVLTLAGKVAVPVRDVSMGYSRCQVKHDDGAISLDIILVP